MDLSDNVPSINCMSCNQKLEVQDIDELGNCRFCGDRA